MLLMASLIQSLSAERVSVSSLRDLYERFEGRPDFVRQAIAAVGQLDADVAWRAVWLLKQGALSGRLSEADLGKVAELVDSSEHWVFRLTMCQLFAASGGPEEVGAQVFPFLLRCFDDRRVIVRAWALSAMALLKQKPYHADFERSWLAAETDPSKSMQARLRRLRGSPKSALRDQKCERPNWPTR